MKKLLIALMLLAIAVIPMFATGAESNPVYTDDKLLVKVTVGEVSEYGFTSAKATDKSAHLTLLTDDQVLDADKAASNDGYVYNQFYTSVRTNNSGQVTVKVSTSNLELKTTENTVTSVIDEIPLHIIGAGTDGKFQTINVANNEGLNVYSESFNIFYAKSEFDAATTGTYEATVTMEIAGV